MSGSVLSAEGVSQKLRRSGFYPTEFPSSKVHRCRRNVYTKTVNSVGMCDRKSI